MKEVLNKKLYGVLIMFILAFLPFNAMAQSSSIEDSYRDFLEDFMGLNELTERQTSFDIHPRNPKPGQEISVKLSSSQYNLSLSNISWILDGSTQSSGRGNTSFTFTAKDVGNASRFGAIIHTPLGERVERYATVTPADVDLIWQANSYTPPFYKGKALKGPQGSVEFIAIPRFSSPSAIENSNNFNFTWSLNGQNRSSESGIGKNSFMLNDPPRRLYKISVTVEEISSGRSVSKIITMRDNNTKVLMYPSTSYGFNWDRALKNNEEVLLPDDQEERTFIAIPYFFDIDSIFDESLSFEWEINRNNIDVNYPLITFKRTADHSGRSLISVNAQNQNQLFQRGKTKFFLNYRGR